VSEMVTGRASITDVRDLEIDDLLGRDPVSYRNEDVAASLSGKVVMVTGAGGSIGSELCRQIIRQQPSALVLFDQSEYGLYQVERELSVISENEQLEIPIHPLLGSVTHRRRCGSAMRTFGVQIVYHAAAYKHVPLVEQNVIEGIQNNVFGTWYTAEAAITAGVERFVLVSTDKAVRPTNVMGASKRLAELVLQGAGPAPVRHRLLHGAFRQRPGFIRLRCTPVPRTDSQRRPRDRDPPGHHPLFHDHSRGQSAGAAGRGHG